MNKILFPVLSLFFFISSLWIPEIIYVLAFLWCSFLCMLVSYKALYIHPRIRRLYLFIYIFFIIFVFLLAP